VNPVGRRPGFGSLSDGISHLKQSYSFLDLAGLTYVSEELDTPKKGTKSIKCSEDEPSCISHIPC